MGRRKDLDLEDRLEEAVDNVRRDRGVVNSLLVDLIIYMKKDTSAHKDCGLIASKYVETLQRSNEQLVKITNILYKKDSVTQGLTELDKDTLFDLIKNGEDLPEGD
jgi:hypothetical protein